ncbi:VOC family protein [Pseudomaricurvus alkylphenolicus]|uniref:VOC family protein n=1 Tax=Pseudomaricurvus alkylphenolicus TaxID=1306991 RepID=UPI00141E4C15|nr:VOC family protein [Pseudomaricurvus alkylphenolicus]NIB45222.1 VOC family protein [Pseudomaricurvus alkylphenolicus]
MHPAIIDIDHVMIRCRPLSEAVKHYQTLGFTVRDARYHADMGGNGEGGSATVSFPASTDECANYLELSHATQDSPMYDYLQGEGAALIMNGCRDYPGFLADLDKIETFIQSFVLPMEAREGIPAQTIQGAMSIDAGLNLLMGAVNYEHTREYQHPELTSHANGTVALRSLTYVTPNGALEDAVKSFSAFYGAAPNTASTTNAQWQLTGTTLTAMEADEAKARYGQLPAHLPDVYVIGMEVADLATTKAFFANGGITYRESKAGIFIDAVPGQPLLEFSQQP